MQLVHIRFHLLIYDAVHQRYKVAVRYCVWIPRENRFMEKWSLYRSSQNNEKGRAAVVISKVHQLAPPFGECSQRIFGLI